MQGVVMSMEKTLQEQMQKETAGKSREEAEKIVQDKSAQMQVASSEAQSKLKASLETALAEISKEKNLSAVLIKDAVPSGGVDVTDEVIKKMKSVIPPKALTTTTMGCDLASFVTICFRLRMLSTEPTDVPPNFNTFIWFLKKFVRYNSPKQPGRD